MTKTFTITDLIEIMARLRDKESGCPWDIEQDFDTIAPYTIEEAYEVADAIERKDFAMLKEELGDLLFQVVYHARMAEEDGLFDFNDVVDAVSDKMVRRHPHVFAGQEGIDSAHVQTEAWEATKAKERKKKAKAAGDEHSLLDDVPVALPALLRAEKLQKRAARVGFDWPEAKQVLDKIEEEIGELREEMEKPSPSKALVADEVGDLLFALVNLARHVKVDSEDALRGTNAKFKKRFHYIEERLREQKRDIHDVSLEELEDLWQAAKKV